MSDILPGVIVAAMLIGIGICFGILIERQLHKDDTAALEAELDRTNGELNNAIGSALMAEQRLEEMKIALRVSDRINLAMATSVKNDIKLS
jgi:hypothetical protein